MGYAIAAYAIVIGTLLAYGLWIQAQRRAVMRELRQLEARAAGADAARDEPASGA